MPAIALTGKTIVDATYEIEEDDAHNKRHLHYLSGGDGLFAIYVMDKSGKDKMYYLHTDYQGSYETITDEEGAIVEKLSFDPWGRRRNPHNWTFTDVPGTFTFDRGYTGHEQMDAFGLINMNGRMYDPMLGRFLSPDNYVQAPDYTQNFNRYSYVLNNPLKYTDPSGEWIHIVIGAVIGGIFNWVTHGAQFNAAGLGYFGVGALAGALAAGIGAGVGTLAAGSGSFGFSVSAGLSAGGFGAGAAVGAAAGLTSGFLSGTGNSLIAGNNIGQSLNAGLKEGVKQGIIGGVMGGIGGGIRASRNGGDFWTGRSKLVPVSADRSLIDLQYDCTLDVPRSEIKPHYLNSQLEFNGESLELVNNYSDGTYCVEDSWGAISGPYGNGALPNGNYIGDNLRTRTESGFTKNGVGFSIDLNPQFQTTRTLLRIHPDGGGIWHLRLYWYSRERSEAECVQ